MSTYRISPPLTFVAHLNDIDLIVSNMFLMFKRAAVQLYSSQQILVLSQPDKRQRRRTAKGHVIPEFRLGDQQES